MGRIRPMRLDDVPAVASMHRSIMGTTQWGQLGGRFLRALYRQLLAHPLFLGFVYEEDSRIRGFIAGTEDGSALFRTTLVRRGHHLIRPTLYGLFRRPRLIFRLLQTPAYFRSSNPVRDVSAESFFCAFERHLRGLRVSGHINKVLFDELAARGHRFVKVSTEVSNKGANRQLLSWGFEERGRFSFYRTPMVTYVLDMTNSPRVEPIRRW
jgi:hypothetical protein